VRLPHRIDELYTAYPFYGSRRIATRQGQEAAAVNREAAHRRMRQMGIADIAPGPNTSKRVPAHRIYPYLLGSVASAHPDHAWGMYIHPAASGMDVHGRRPRGPACGCGTCAS